MRCGGGLLEDNGIENDGRWMDGRDADRQEHGENARDGGADADVKGEGKWRTGYALPWPPSTGARYRRNGLLYHIPRPFLATVILSLSLPLPVSSRDPSFISSPSGRTCPLVLLVPDTAAVDLSLSPLRQ